MIFEISLPYSRDYKSSPLVMILEILLVELCSPFCTDSAKTVVFLKFKATSNINNPQDYFQELRHKAEII